MEVDFTNAPEAFADANERARLDYLKSLTVERAARDLEDVLDLAEEVYRSSKDANVPPPLPNPLPGPTLAILLGWNPSDPDDAGGREASGREASGTQARRPAEAKRP